MGLCFSFRLGFMQLETVPIWDANERVWAWERGRHKAQLEREGGEAPCCLDSLGLSVYCGGWVSHANLRRSALHTWIYWQDCSPIRNQINTSSYIFTHSHKLVHRWGFLWSDAAHFVTVCTRQVQFFLLQDLDHI